MPESFSRGDHFVFSRDSARWAFDYVDFHTQVAYSYAIEDVKAAREKWEGGALRDIPVIDQAALEIFKRSPAEAWEFLTDFSVRNADAVVDAWWKLGDALLVKYNHFSMYNAERRSTGRVQTPEWWNRAVVEHDELVPFEKPQPPRR
jgi:dipeptidase